MYKRHRFPPEIIQHVVWLYHRYNLSSRDIEDLTAERIDELLPEIAYRVVENESGKLEWQGNIDGHDVIETSEPLASRWRRFKAWFFKIVPDRQL
jgi:hypothetical protein